jgi:cell division protein ZapA (FtsZ GTPase activity inhibitor)
MAIKIKDEKGTYIENPRVYQILNALFVNSELSTEVGSITSRAQLVEKVIEPLQHSINTMLVAVVAFD